MAAGSCGAADIWPTPHLITRNIGASTNEVFTGVASDGGLYKLGTGTTTFEGPRFSSEAELHVYGGSAVLNLDTATAVPYITSLTNKIAFWLDVTSNVVTDAEGNFVEKWLDRRETLAADATATNYPFAEAGNRRNQFTNTVYEAERRPGFVSNANFGSRKVADFGPCGSSARWLHIVNSGVGDTWSYVRAREVFAVCARRTDDNNYGHLISLSAGDTGNPTPAWVASKTSVWGDTQNVWIDKSLTWLDGERVPSSHLQVYDGKAHLLEGCLPMDDFTCKINQIGLDRAMPKYSSEFGASGGFYLAELIVFNCRLTAFDRLRVQNYLQRKWFAAAPASVGRLDVTTNATVVVNGVADVSGALSGGGALTKRGAGRLTVRNAGFTGTATLEAGSLRTDTLALAVPAAGTSFAVAANGVVSSGSDTAGTIRKTGAGSLAVASLPAATTNLVVEGGTLTLRAGAESAQPLPALTTLQDGDFESYAATLKSSALSVNVGGGAGTSAPQTNTYAWVFDRSTYASGGNLVCMLSSRTAQNDAGNWSLCPLDRQGLGYCGMSQLYICHGSATALFDVAEAGFYTVSFHVTSRHDGSHKEMAFLVDGVEQRRFKSYDAYEFMRYEFALPWLGVGSHTITFADTDTDTNTVLIDDVKILPRALFETAPTVVEIANPGFDLPIANASFSWKNNVWSSTKPTLADCTGWTLPAEATNNYFKSQIVRRFDDRFSDANSDLNKVGLTLAPEEMPEGFLCAQLYATNAFAQSVAFSSAGRYRLSYALAKRPTAAIQSVCVRVGDRTVGWHVVSHDAFRRYRVTFDIAEAGTRTLSFQGKVSRTDYSQFANSSSMDGGAYLDDVALVRIGDVPTDNLVANGDFETTGSWTLSGTTDYAVGTSDKATFGNGRWMYNLELVSPANKWPRSQCRGPIDGGNALVLGGSANQTASAAQTLTLAAGRYELAYRHSAALLDGASPAADTFRVKIAPTGQTTANCIQSYTILSHEDPADECVAFTVPADGSYTLSFAATFAQQGAVMLDDVVLRATATPAATALGAEIPSDLNIAVTDGAMLDLDFDGRATVHRVSYAGHRCAGVISHVTCPAWVMGRGELYAAPSGTLLLFR